MAKKRIKRAYKRSKLGNGAESGAYKKRRSSWVGRFGTFLLIVVVVVVAYQQYCISQMRNGMYGITSKVHVEEIGGKPASSERGRNSDLVTSLAQAERHTRIAKELIREKKTAQAQAELDKALRNLKSAHGVSSDIVGSAAQFLGKTKDNAVSVFQKAWKDISEEAKNKK